MTKKTILIVDDDPTVLMSISRILRDKYRVRATKSGHHALQLAEGIDPPDLILLDIMMPHTDGFSVLKSLQENRETRKIPVIFVTSKINETDEEKGLQMGAVDYITKPISPIILQARLHNHLLLKQAQDYLEDKNVYLQHEVARRMDENEQIQNVSIRALAHLAETRDPETGDHILRTQEYVRLLGRLLLNHPKYADRLCEEYIDLLTRSAPLHDIGKVGIPDSVLLKPGRFDRHEWEIMKNHALLGARAIEMAEKDIDRPVEFLSLAKEIAHWHHERWDGGGYPDGLAGEAIPLSARIMAIADVFDALVSSRVYKPPMGFDKAHEILSEQRGKHFDPDIIDLFLANYDKFTRIAQANLQANNDASEHQ